MSARKARAHRGEALQAALEYEEALELSRGHDCPHSVLTADERVALHREFGDDEDEGE